MIERRSERLDGVVFRNKRIGLDTVRYRFKSVDQFGRCIVGERRECGLERALGPLECGGDRQGECGAAVDAARISVCHARGLAAHPLEDCPVVGVGDRERRTAHHAAVRRFLPRWLHRSGCLGRLERRGAVRDSAECFGRRAADTERPALVPVDQPRDELIPVEPVACEEASSEYRRELRVVGDRPRWFAVGPVTDERLEGAVLAGDSVGRPALDGTTERVATG